eukprot:Hpha_TRINITY_DN1961_c0_g1::TRINITY_DN1961_c0_g1_i2::g.31112::m.31112
MGGRREQITPCAPEPLCLIQACHIAPHVPPLPLANIERRHRAQFRAVLRAAHTFGVRRLVLPLPLLPADSDSTHLRAAAAAVALLCCSGEVLGLTDLLVSCTIENARCVQSAIEKALKGEGVATARCSIRVVCKEGRYVAGELSRNRLQAGLVVPATTEAILQGVVGGRWENGRGSKYGPIEEAANSTTLLLAHTGVVGRRMFRAERVLQLSSEEGGKEHGTWAVACASPSVVEVVAAEADVVASHSEVEVAAVEADAADLAGRADGIIVADLKLDGSSVVVEVTSVQELRRAARDFFGDAVEGRSFEYTSRKRRRRIASERQFAALRRLVEAGTVGE